MCLVYNSMSELEQWSHEDPNTDYLPSPKWQTLLPYCSRHVSLGLLLLVALSTEFRIHSLSSLYMTAPASVGQWRGSARGSAFLHKEWRITFLCAVLSERWMTPSGFISVEDTSRHSACSVNSELVNAGHADQRRVLFDEDRLFGVYRTTFITNCKKIEFGTLWNHEDVLISIQPVKILYSPFFKLFFVETFLQMETKKVWIKV